MPLVPELLFYSDKMRALVALIFAGLISLSPELRAEADFSRQLQSDKGLLSSQGYRPWRWRESNCSDCEVVMLATNPTIKTKNVERYIHALTDHRQELLRLYRIDGGEYNLLARMAVGILGRESRFFESPRYRFKESFPWAVHIMKLMRAAATGAAVDRNSRGPTQIKVVPSRIAEHYGVNVDNLNVPENAALATMGFLIEALTELKTRRASNHLDFINEDNYVDYLPYIYFGSTRTLIAGKARPESNLYVREMKRFMGWVELYERAPLAPARPETRTRLL